jgi:hypothetical protein
VTATTAVARPLPARIWALAGTVSSMDAKASGRRQLWRAVGVVTFVGAALLLLSFGGAIIAAPLTLPLMFLASRRQPTHAFRRAAVVIGALTAAEAGWAMTYLLLAESRPWIWLLPACSAAVAAWVYASPNRRVGPLRTT